MVPFGDMLWARQIVEIWLDEREAGPVFTAMIDGRGDMLDQRTRRKRMTTSSVQRMLKRYPISIDGTPTTVTPHALRRSYARNLFLAGIPNRSYSAESQLCGCQDDAGLYWCAGWLDPCAGKCVRSVYHIVDASKSTTLSRHNKYGARNRL